MTQTGELQYSVNYIFQMRARFGLVAAKKSQTLKQTQSKTKMLPQHFHN